MCATEYIKCFEEFMYLVMFVGGMCCLLNSYALGGFKVVVVRVIASMCILC